MFGFKRKKPVELIPFSEGKPRTLDTLLCDGVTARNLPSFAELLAVHAQLQREHPDCRVLASLDNLGQAAYTSGHATDANELDEVEGHDLSRLPEAAFEDGEHLGYLSTPEEFPIRLANLLRRVEAVGLADVAGVLDWETTGDANDPVTVNRDPEGALRIAAEKEVIFQFVPVTRAVDAIAAFPNGYFVNDLDPMQNHALARHLEAEYGLALFGVGSRFLGFRAVEPLAKDAARTVADDVARLYAGAPPTAADTLARVITGRDWLLLRYTES